MYIYIYTYIDIDIERMFFVGGYMLHSRMNDNSFGGDVDTLIDLYMYRCICMFIYIYVCMYIYICTYTPPAYYMSSCVSCVFYMLFLFGKGCTVYIQIHRQYTCDQLIVVL